MSTVQRIKKSHKLQLLQVQSKQQWIIGESGGGVEGQVAGKRSSVEVEERYVQRYEDKDKVRHTCKATKHVKEMRR